MQKSIYMVPLYNSFIKRLKYGEIVSMRRVRLG